MARWSIRRKLAVLVTIPLIVLLVGGGLLVASIGLQYRQAHTARLYADAILPALRVSSALTNEFGDTHTAASASALQQARTATDSQVGQLKPLLKGFDSGSSALAQSAQTVESELGSLANSRGLVDRLIASKAFGTAAGNNQVDSSTVSLRNSIQALLDNLTSATSPDGAATRNASFVAAMSRVMQAAAAEREVVDTVLTGQNSVSTDRFAALKQLQAAQDVSLQTAQTVAGTQEQQRLSAVSNLDSTLSQWRTSLQQQLNNPNGFVAGQEPSWRDFSTNRLNTIAEIAYSAAKDTQSTARTVETSALIRVAAVAGAVLITLLMVTALLTSVARSVTGPLRRLRAGAVELASIQLPAAVARIEQDGVSADVSLPAVLPADDAAGPETLEVARAVDDLGAEAVRLATAQVRLRRALDEAFVSMSRRSQSMVEKQLAIIDDLESQEQDPDQLRNLFRLDHLAARMRRYNDNLLVLAGSAVRTRATAPVKIAELFRAATSEMEQYERVRLQPVSGASIAGTVAGELVHLLAELLDNAAMYSPPSSAIVLSAAFTADGGLQIEVLDAGVGISPGELERLNARLSQPESIDTQVPSRMGLFVVARLARRGTFGVMLQSRPDAAGTIALVRVPAGLVIGAPGSTGETPSLQLATLRQPPSAVAAAASSSASEPARPGERLGERQPEPAGLYAALSSPATGAIATGAVSSAAVAAAAASASAAAATRAASAAGIRSVMDDAGQPPAALPRRRRGQAVASTGNAGAPLDPLAPANPATGLFTPSTPPLPESRDERSEEEARGPLDTSPGGVPALRLPARNEEPTLEPPARGADRGLDQGELADRLPTEAPRQFVRPPAADLPAPAATNGSAPHPGDLRHALDSRDALDSREPLDPLTAATGEFRAAPNVGLPTSVNRNGAGSLPDDWEDDLPTELAARAAAAASYRPTDPYAPMIGENASPDFDDPTPIFDQISVWFTADPTGNIPALTDLDAPAQDDAGQDGSTGRWAALGDQRWLATNARAAAAPETEGATETGLPKRRPGANLLPSAATAAPGQVPLPSRSTSRSTTSRKAAMAAAAAAASSADAADAAVLEAAAAGNEPPTEAEEIRGRLGSYQRGLADARRVRPRATPAPSALDAVGASLFTAHTEPGEDVGAHLGDPGGDE